MIKDRPIMTFLLQTCITKSLNLRLHKSVVALGTYFTHKKYEYFSPFYSCDAVLERYMLWSGSVRLSVCHNPVFYRNGWTDQAAGYPLLILHCVIKEFGYLQK